MATLSAKWRASSAVRRWRSLLSWRSLAVADFKSAVGDGGPWQLRGSDVTLQVGASYRRTWPVAGATGPGGAGVRPALGPADGGRCTGCAPVVPAAGSGPPVAAAVVARGVARRPTRSPPAVADRDRCFASVGGVKRLRQGFAGGGGGGGGGGGQMVASWRRLTVRRRAAAQVIDNWRDGPQRNRSTSQTVSR